MARSGMSMRVRMITSGLAAVLLGGCALFSPLPTPTTLEDRLEMFPSSGLALQEPVTIRWNKYHVPYIEAQNDADAAYALGLVHAHLRLGQMELVRRAARGRVAEIAGPVGPVIDIDAAIRAFGIDRGVGPSLEQMPPSTRAWLDRFVAGINDYIAQSDELPHEYAVAGLDIEPWTAADVLAIGRLGSVDITWGRWIGLLQRRSDPNWPTILAEALEKGRDNPVTFTAAEAARPPGDEGAPDEAAPTDQTPSAEDNDGEENNDDGVSAAPQEGAGWLRELLDRSQRHGSNTFVISSDKSATGAGLIANDPHLGLLLPNVWFLAGLKTPDMQTVGFMAPGLPVFALGRNEDIAWGGTNLHSTQSDLVDVSDLPPSAFTTRTERIKVRFRWSSTVEFRMSKYGAVVSDIPWIRENFNIPDDMHVALRWIAHQPSDEITSLLKVQRASNFQEFRAAFENYAQPALNMLYADKTGHIGHVIAARLPRRPLEAPDDIFVTPEESDKAWASFSDALDLPYAHNPAKGFLASSNNRPTDADIPIGYFYTSRDRVLRLNDVLSKADDLSWENLAVLQQDVYALSSVELRDALIARIDAFADDFTLDNTGQSAFEMIRDWDGHYRVDSEAAVAFEGLTIALAPGLAPKEIPEPERVQNFDAVRLKELLLKRLAETDDAALQRLLVPAFAAAAEAVAKVGTWGNIHRLQLSYPLSNVPLLGDRYPTTDLPTGGSSDTVMKTAHAPTLEKHATRYGSQARHVSDLNDPDANYFVLTGGQDGWLNSSTFMDQVPLWQDGEYIRLPLTQERIEAEFPLVIELK